MFEKKHEHGKKRTTKSNLIMKKTEIKQGKEEFFFFFNALVGAD